ncbi:MAG: AI-2E family transporter [Elusimicrobia bacterium]|nr:AI-2E family transporter [Elusimicrobiota bacterium]
MTKTTDRTHLIAFLAVLLGCAVFVVRMASPYLLALFLGGLMSMLGHRCCRWLQVRGVMPRLASALTTTLMAIAIIGPFVGFAAMGVREGLAVRRSLGDGSLSTDGVAQALRRSEPLRRAIVSQRVLMNVLHDSFRRLEEYAGAIAVAWTKAVPEFLLQIALAVISCYFFLLDGERLTRWLLALSALDQDVQEALITSFRDTAVSAVLAGLAAAACQAACISASFALLDIPRPFLAGAATFILAWIPIVGSIPASLAGIAYLYLQGSPSRAALMIAAAVAIGSIDNLVRPLVLKGRDAMHPLTGLLAVLGGIEMFGVMGLFIGPVLAATLIELLDLWPSISGRYGVELKSPPA